MQWNERLVTFCCADEPFSDGNLRKAYLIKVSRIDVWRVWLRVLAKCGRPQDSNAHLQFDRLDPTRGLDRMFVMKVAKDPKDRHRVEQYERDVKTQLIAAECAQHYNKQVCLPNAHAHSCCTQHVCACVG